ncbi:ankyrin repeat domain-containing protein [Endozoicomonas sp. 8E]|nr:ankyrin repeat domain-containing protein [Endozoicomonas sp. 8E]WOG28641.1 ankyrin repeat domain-containing protein [Endozoicomonas sp. 8E]
MFYLWMTLIAALFSWTLKADLIEICLDCFHNRNTASVFVNTRCGHFYHLDCLTRQFVIQPTGSRQCGYCRQNPIPVLNWNTGESHPDAFFPDQTFYDACYGGDLDQVEKSLAEGVNVNAVMTDDFTPLMLAASGGHTDVVERLINAGANLNAARA